MGHEYSKRDIGRMGEDVACQFLVKKGYKVLVRNYRQKCGEIDIIAERNGVVRFVEVKSVSRDTLPDVLKEENEYRPEEMVHAAKLKKIARTAEVYMLSKKDDREYQIDVIGVFLNVSTRNARCRLLENVF
jgi:putative endonuclease